jgi:glycosyltransferase involved in cell wall biosynthesis
LDNQRDKVFSSILSRWGFGHATMVYSMFGEGWSFLEAAKQRGLRIALDIFINPVAHRIVESERQMFPEWETPCKLGFHEQEEKVDKRIALADLLLCPADAVVDGLRYYPSFAEEKAVVVPYGFAGDIHPQGIKPLPRRVLFGGAATLRKGIHYFARAAELLSRNAKDYEFRVAGPATHAIRSRPECRLLKFLGPLTRSDFLAELEAADMFVLPTLAEGSATVIYESLALGVPVVTTRNAGSVITSGKEGFVVPERDSAALADAIAAIASRRDLRGAMSIEGIRTAMQYSEAKWGERLISTLRSIH